MDDHPARTAAVSGMGEKLLYAVDERALCFHGPLIYEAKIKKSEVWTPESNRNRASGPHYFVHYKNWKNTWDEWVPEDRLLKYNEVNIAKQKQLNAVQSAKDKLEREVQAAAAKAAGTAKRASDVGATRGVKRQREPDQEEEYYNRPEIKIWIPDELKVQLVDDWEAVTKNLTLVPLPRKPSVQQLLDDFESFSETSKTIHRTPSLTKEVVAGLRLYFDKCLGNNLLYRFERQQYGEMRKKHGDDMEASAVYGAEHLLRLFVNLPELIAHTNMDAESVGILKDALADFLKWMAKEQKRIFVTMADYQATASAYQNMARA